MSDTKPNPEEIETPSNEYEEIFAKLAVDEEPPLDEGEVAVVSEAEISNLKPEIDDVEITASLAELKPAIEAVLFVADEPVPFNHLCKVLGDVNSADVYATLVELMSDYEARNSGLELREVGGGWRISTRPQQHEFIRKYLKSKPSEIGRAHV